MSSVATIRGGRARFPDIRSEIVKRTVREKIGDKISMLIASGVLQIGDELPSERELASLLSVSRETVRGAIQALAAKGVVEVSQGARTRVVSADVGVRKIGLTTPSAINSYDLDSVHKARLLVERAVVAEAAGRIDEATLRQLDLSLATQKEAINDPVRFLICDREFHATIYRLSANPLLADFAIDLYAYMLDYRRAAMSRPGAIRASHNDHARIVEALRTRDPTAVVDAFERHINRIYATTVPILRERRKRRPRDDAV